MDAPAVVALLVGTGVGVVSSMYVTSAMGVLRRRGDYRVKAYETLVPDVEARLCAIQDAGAGEVVAAATALREPMDRLVRTLRIARNKYINPDRLDPTKLETIGSTIQEAAKAEPPDEATLKENARTGLELLGALEKRLMAKL